MIELNKEIIVNEIKSTELLSNIKTINQNTKIQNINDLSQKTINHLYIQIQERILKKLPITLPILRNVLV